MQDVEDAGKCSYKSVEIHSRRSTVRMAKLHWLITIDSVIQLVGKKLHAKNGISKHANDK